LAWSGSRDSIQKKWNPVLISATAEANNFKFGTQLGFVEQLIKNQF